MAKIKTKGEIEILRVAGKRLAFIIDAVSRLVKPGITTAELDEVALELVREEGDIPAFLHYKQIGESRAYPATLCVSVNDEIVHGVPAVGRKLNEGDIVGLDLGLARSGLFVDSAITVSVGKVGEKEKEMMDTVEGALYAGIDAARAGKRTGDIGYAIQSFIEPHGFGIIKDLAGHGVGHAVHEDPFVPNYGIPGTGDKLKEGMVIAIEPMAALGKGYIKLGKDGFTYKTRDGTASAHFEHTIAITKNKPIILTKI